MAQETRKSWYLHSFSTLVDDFLIIAATGPDNELVFDTKKIKTWKRTESRSKWGSLAVELVVGDTFEIRVIQYLSPPTKIKITNDESGGGDITSQSGSSISQSTQPTQQTHAVVPTENILVLYSYPLAQLSPERVLRVIQSSDKLSFLFPKEDNTFVQTRLTFSRRNYKSSVQACNAFVQFVQEIPLVNVLHRKAPGAQPVSEEVLKNFGKTYLSACYSFDNAHPLDSIPLDRSKLEEMIQDALADPAFPNLVKQLESYANNVRT